MRAESRRPGRTPARRRVEARPRSSRRRRHARALRRDDARHGARCPRSRHERAHAIHRRGARARNRGRSDTSADSGGRIRFARLPLPRAASASARVRGRSSRDAGLQAAPRRRGARRPAAESHLRAARSRPRRSFRGAREARLRPGAAHVRDHGRPYDVPLRGSASRSVPVHCGARARHQRRLRFRDASHGGGPEADRLEPDSGAGPRVVLALPASDGERALAVRFSGRRRGRVALRCGLRASRAPRDRRRGIRPALFDEGRRHDVGGEGHAKGEELRKAAFGAAASNATPEQLRAIEERMREQARQMAYRIAEAVVARRTH